MHGCSECGDRIANPICHECLSQGVAAWMGEKLGLDGAHAVFEISGALTKPFGDVSCIKCGEPVSICADCFTKELAIIMRHHPVTTNQSLFCYGFEDPLRSRAIPARR